MLRPAVFFDRDNTLIVSDGYLGDPTGVQLIAGAAQAIAQARSLGFAVVVVSNQSGVARGMFTEEAVRAVNRRLDELLRQQNPAAVIDRHEFCPYHPEATVEQYRKDSDLRKPAPGMLLQAAKTLNLDLSRSWLIGDAPRDIAAGRAAGCRTILFHDPSLPPSPAAEPSDSIRADFTVSTLEQAMDVIKQNSGSDPTPGDLAKLQATAEQILQTLRKPPEPDVPDFSPSKLFAGIVQILALAALFYAYLNLDRPTSLQNTLLFALVLQTLTVSLLIMGKQK